MTREDEPLKIQATENDPYRELFERSADAILLIDGETFVDCNQATVDMLRYKNKAELLQTHPSELSPEFQPDGRTSFDKANEMMAIAFRQGSHRFEWDHIRADGEVFPVEVLLTPVPRGDGHILHCVWRDITERKQLEAELRQSQRMEAIGQLTGGIAHDFNNLLVVILGHSDLLEADLERWDPEALRGHVTEIRRAGERAATLVEQLLSFSRKQVLQPRSLELNEVLADLDSMLARVLGESVQVETRTSDRPLRVKADPTQLEQMVINLATNARDAMPGGGTLTLETSEVAVGERSIGDASRLEAGRYAVLSVADTGVGMPQQTLGKIFEPFFTTKPQGQGTGLGLSTVYGLSRQSGGDVTVLSEPGKGSLFKVFLPLSVEESAPLPGSLLEDDELPLGGDETVLVVEDESTVGDLMEDVLTGAGYAVVRAGDGKEALELVARRNLAFDLLLTDVVMPRLGGPELARELARTRPDLKVLFASGYTDNALMGRGSLDEGVHLLSKPFSPRVLLRRVRELLGRPAVSA